MDFKEVLAKVQKHADEHYDGMFTILRGKPINNELKWLFCFQRVDEVDSDVESAMASGDTIEDAMLKGLEMDISYLEIESNIIGLQGKKPTFFLTATDADKLWNLPDGSVRGAINRKNDFRELALKGHIRKAGTVWLVSDVAMIDVYGEITLPQDFEPTIPLKSFRSKIEELKRMA
jgi:hypothetical protein